MVSDHITSLGFRLEFAEDVGVVEPLLAAVGLETAPREPKGWQRSSYLIACTRAGGLAASVGWTRNDDNVIIHSLAVAQPTRGSGIGAGILGSAIGYIMDKRPARAFWLVTESGGARHMFASMGFHVLDPEDMPGEIAEHPIFTTAKTYAKPMVRDYSGTPRGLDKCAFRMIQNDTPEATTPLGSVFFFKQTGSVIEAAYRGGPVIRGHLIGSIEGDAIRFCWHQFTDEGRLMNGDGNISLDQLPDGRRELRERFQGGGELLLREV